MAKKHQVKRRSTKSQKKLSKLIKSNQELLMKFKSMNEVSKAI